MFKNQEDVDRILNELGRKLDMLNKDIFDLLVCGGTALLALQLIFRTTRDVDILAKVVSQSDGSLEPVAMDLLPPVLTEAVAIVAKENKLPPDWLNSNLSHIFAYGLPAGLLERTIVKSYGKSLNVRFLGRLDQIHLKLFAAVDAGGKHLEDLVLLSPTRDEIGQAERWLHSIDIPESYKIHLSQVIKTIREEE